MEHCCHTLSGATQSSLSRLVSNVHVRPQMECIYSCHGQRCLKNGRLILISPENTLLPLPLLYPNKCQISPIMYYRCHIGTRAAQLPHTCQDRIQKRLRGLVGDELFSTPQSITHRRNIIHSIAISTSNVLTRYII